MRSNCVFRSWHHFANGDAKWMCLRRTKYAMFSKHSRRWYWRPLEIIGTGTQWVGMWITWFGWLLRWGGWYHAVWILPNGQWWEFQPEDSKRDRVLPPIIFTGRDSIIKKR